MQKFRCIIGPDSFSLLVNPNGISTNATITCSWGNVDEHTVSPRKPVKGTGTGVPWSSVNNIPDNHTRIVDRFS